MSIKHPVNLVDFSIWLWRYSKAQENGEYDKLNGEDEAESAKGEGEKGQTASSSEGRHIQSLPGLIVAFLVGTAFFLSGLLALLYAISGWPAVFESAYFSRWDIADYGFILAVTGAAIVAWAWRDRALLRRHRAKEGSDSAGHPEPVIIEHPRIQWRTVAARAMVVIGAVVCIAGLVSFMWGFVPDSVSPPGAARDAWRAAWLPLWLVGVTVLWVGAKSKKKRQKSEDDNRNGAKGIEPLDKGKKQQ